MDGNSLPKNRYITPLINSLPGSHDLVIWNKIFVPWETQHVNVRSWLSRISPWLAAKLPDVSRVPVLCRGFRLKAAIICSVINDCEKPLSQKQYSRVDIHDQPQFAVYGRYEV